MVGHYLANSRWPSGVSRNTLGRYYQLGRARGLGDYYRPNQAYDRGVFRGRTSLTPHLGALDTSSSLVWIAAGAAAIAGILWLAKPSRSTSRKVAQLAARRALASKALRELEA